MIDPCSVEDAWLGGAEWYVAWRLVWVYVCFFGDLFEQRRWDGTDKERGMVRKGKGEGEGGRWGINAMEVDLDWVEFRAWSFGGSW